MTTRQRTILHTLEERGLSTTFSLAMAVDAPKATVRRNIQRLRQLGYNIQYTNGFVRLVSPQEITAQEAGTALAL